MCGIIGYIGSRKKKVPVLVNGLKRVEYRGYDSAGIAVVGGSGLIVCKKAGKVDDFMAYVKSENLWELDTLAGIGHTRWATHGPATDLNAHPHLSCREHVAIVHNGIITNFEDLRTALTGRDHQIRTETDSELLAHLIGECLDGDPVEAVRSALLNVEGSYGIAVIFRDFPDTIVCAKNGSPLHIGIWEDDDKNDYFIASDPASFREHTDKHVALENGQIGVVTPAGYEIMDFDKVRISPKVETIEFSLEQIQLGGFDHFMLREICEQPDSLRNSMGGPMMGRITDGNVIKLAGLDEESVHNLLKRIQNFLFISAGTSLHAGMIGKILLQEISRIPAHWENASEMANQVYPCFPPNSAVWAITQSGETADLILAIEKVTTLGLPCFGICNTVGSTIERMTMAGVRLNAGPEIGVASTKAFTSQVMVLQLISFYLRQLRGIQPEPWMEKYMAGLRMIPEQVQKIVDQREVIKAIAKRYVHYKNFLFLGRGINWPTALEGALKLKEISYIHAEGYAMAEMKHGPIALIDRNFPTMVLAPSCDDKYANIISNIQEIRAREDDGTPPPMVAIANEGDERIASYVDDVIYIPSTSYYLTPLLFVIPLQLFAYYVAVELGCDVDQPRNLAKAVTVP